MNQASSAPGATPRSRYARIAVVGLVAVLTVLGWLLVDGTGSDDGAGPVPTATATTNARTSATPRPTDRPTSTATSTATTTDAETGLPWVEPTALPAEARTTIALIEAGGPFPYAKDGAVFGNREQQLPRRANGYYREYTVVTPGSDDRGERRIVTGDRDRQLFWTDDHYVSFRRVRR